MFATALPGAAQAGDLTAYARARAADADKRADVAVAGYGAALAGAPDSEVVAIRAYRHALIAGDLPLARKAAGVLIRAGVAPTDTAILAFADALKRRDAASASAAVDTLAKGPLDFMAPVLRAWLTFDAGGDPLAVLDASDNALARRFIGEHRALLTIARGDANGGTAMLRAAMTADEDTVALRLNAALLLAGKGRRRDAEALLEGTEPQRATLRGQLGGGARPSAAFGASRLFTRLGADLSRSETVPLAILLARAALLLDPRDDRARLLLGDALSQAGAHDVASATLAQVRARSPYARTARAAEVTVLARAGQTEAAIARARALSEAPGATAADAQLHADLLSGAGRHAEAAAGYATAIQRSGEAGWTLHLQRGGALEQAGQWAEAEPHLERAVELAPDQPVALNYLGYARIERGEDMAEASALLERASRLRPDDPSITDSLAWSYFRRGDVARALPLLEKAAQAQAADATINEHLGDAYWQAGRRFEARYAWRAAALYAKPGEEARRIAGKLAGGPVTPAATK